MKQSLPWTKLRAVITVLGVVSFALTCYGVWLLFVGDSEENATGGDDQVRAVGGFFMALLGAAFSFIGGLLSIIFLAVYLFIIRNLRKSALQEEKKSKIIK